MNVFIQHPHTILIRVDLSTRLNLERSLIFEETSLLRDVYDKLCHNIVPTFDTLCAGVQL